MKIVHISETLVSGVQAYLRNLSTFLSTHAPHAQVYIIYSGQREEFDKAVAEQLFMGKATLIEVPMANSISPLKDLASTVKIYREIQKIKPDVIHLHSSKAGILGRMASIFYRKKKKLFYTPHGYAFLRQDVGNTSRRVFRLIEKYAQFFLGGTTIACGDTEYEIAKGFGRAALMRNGLLFDSQTPVEAQPNNHKLTVGIVSRLTYARSPMLFNKIALRFPDIQFVWIGDGELRHELTAPNIAVTGWLFNHNEVMKHLAGLDIYMQTSLWEGLPFAVLEAMTLQKPVIATNVIGNKDIVVHGKTGFLFADIAELDAFFEVLKDKQVRLEMGREGFKRCKEVFDTNENFKGLLELYLQ
ncbi:hypothetical protein AM493_14410 [Flavobacterium akiainvivens]|uniref:Glycosyltransferase subfamily 4-like N-terminal domain-containing protein n=1 Tax=Flavobacterium akiainvivens TaxID=1202724 RepID=A0A0M8MC71_9FLAO|nr:glycosyltransferase [Flavobacterium akiainvivens]KOS07095.1 hypothetical protein AM493_14410 [Flavobacterium akiainvivens]SFQ75589.1 hypothetical protein SAMN05444144_12212 [Flavobacterium akiainvivens]